MSKRDSNGFNCFNMCALVGLTWVGAISCKALWQIKLISFGSHGCKRLQRQFSMDSSDFFAPQLQLLLWEQKKVTLCKTRNGPRIGWFILSFWAGPSLPHSLLGKYSPVWLGLSAANKSSPRRMLTWKARLWLRHEGHVLLIESILRGKSYHISISITKPNKRVQGFL